MTEQNFQQIYQELVVILEDHNLGWVVDQATSINELSSETAIECKHIENLDLDAASEFLGLTSDLRVKEAWFFVASGNSDGVARMLANDRKEWHHDVVPSASNNVNRLIYALQNSFKNFKAKH